MSEQSTKLHLCTVATHEEKGLRHLVQSAEKNSLKLNILGWGQPFWGLGFKLQSVLEFANTLQDSDLLLFVDAYDVMIMQGEEAIKKRFLEKKVPFIISTETNCWPVRKLASRYPAAPTRFRFLNSGGYMGYAGHIKKLLSNLTFDIYDDDQEVLTRDFLAAPHRYHLDYSCEFFLSLFQVKKEDLDRKKEGFLLKETGSSPLILHGNGPSKGLLAELFDEMGGFSMRP